MNNIDNNNSNSNNNNYGDNSNNYGRKGDINMKNEKNLGKNEEIYFTSLKEIVFNKKVILLIIASILALIFLTGCDSINDIRNKGRYKDEYYDNIHEEENTKQKKDHNILVKENNYNYNNNNN